jgi:hypothetical protein
MLHAACCMLRATIAGAPTMFMQPLRDEPDDHAN